MVNESFQAVIGINYFFHISHAEPMAFLAMGFQRYFLSGSRLGWEVLAPRSWSPLCGITLFLTVRPSIKIKNFAYYASYWKHALWLIGWFVLQTILYTALFFLILILASLMPISVPITPEDQTPLMFLIINLMGFLYLALWAGITSFYAVFLLDSDGSVKAAVKSLARAGKFLLYNIPFYIIMLIILVTLYSLFFLLLAVPLQALGAGSGIIFMQRILDLIITMPIFACVVTNYYIKKIHDQFTLYFGQKS